MYSSVSLNLSLVIFAVIFFSTAKIPQNVEGGKGSFVNLDSLAASDTCNIPPGSRNNSLPLSHTYGPCSLLGGNTTANPNLHDLLHWDKYKLLDIQQSFVNSSTLGGQTMQLLAANMPTQSALTYNIPSFAVKVGLGTPRVEQTLVVTPNHDMTWVRCKPCLNTCPVQQDPLFDPKNSTTYKYVLCGAGSPCNYLEKKTCTVGSCQYTYAEETLFNSRGFLSRETLTLTQTDVIEDFVFGCDYNSTVLSESGAGFLGLGRGNLSLVAQTSATYGSVFSYCLPANSSSTGSLNFGPPDNNKTKYTPLLSNIPTSYNLVEMLGLSVNGKPLDIEPAIFELTFVESNVQVTAFPEPAYVALREVFRGGMTNYKLAEPFGVLDTCYDTIGLRSMVVPTVELHFRDMILPLSGNQIIYRVGTSRACLAFMSIPRNLTVIGYTQQKGVEVVYDLARNQLGFGQGTC